MTYNEDQLKNMMLNTFYDNGVEGDIPELLSSILGKYLYLHQMVDVSILMEKSFLRSKNLNSKITHAADAYYSVFRGSNRMISIDNIGCSEQVDVKKFDLIGTFGDYKLYFAHDYKHVELFNKFTFNAYLALGNNTIEFEGNGKLYYDIVDKDISDDIEVYNKITGEKYKVTDDISNLYNNDDDLRSDIAIITLPDYSVRLWKSNKFMKSNIYVVKYLKSPNKSIEDLDLSKIKTIPKFIKASGTSIIETKQVQYKNDNPDLIYLYAATYAKFKDIMRSNLSIRTSISEHFPEIKGFNLVIDTNEISVYYTTGATYPSEPLDPVKLRSFNTKMKSYFIKQDINFYGAEISTLVNYEISIKYNKVLNFDVCDNLIRSFQYNVGVDFNPYQLIADLMSSDSLRGNIKRVDIPYDSMLIVPMEYNQRIYFDNIIITYEAL